MADSNRPYVSGAADNSGISLSQSLLNFVSWWGARLRECLPSPLQRWLSGEKRLPVLGIVNQHLCLWSANDQAKLLHRFALDEGRQHNSTQLAAMLRPLGEVKSGVNLVANEEHILRRQIDLPTAAAANLRQTLAYDLDRLTPYSSDQVLFDAQVLEGQGNSRLLKAQFIATPKAELTPLLNACQEAGVSVDRVLPSLKPSDSGLNLQSSVVVVRKTPWYQHIWPWASILCVAFLAVALLFPLWQKRQRIIATHQMLADAQKAAIAAEAVQKEVLNKSTQYNTLLAKRHSTPLAVQLLDEVTRKVPDDTWVQNFELRTNKQSRELMLVGDTNSSSKLISWFEGSPLFAQASFKSPLTRNQAAGANAERFQVALEVKNVALPTPVSLMEVKPEIKADTKSPAGTVKETPKAPVKDDVKKEETKKGKA